MNDIDKTLSERKAVYGPYRKGCQIRRDLLKTITDAFEEFHGVPMPSLYVHYFWDIVNKLCRLAITPDHKDSWHDMVGYSKRIEEFIEEGHDE